MNKFVIKKGNKYVKFDRRHRITLTTISSQATLFDYSRAVATIENFIPKRERKSYEVVELTDSEMKFMSKGNQLASTTVQEHMNITELCNHFGDLCYGFVQVAPYLNECKAEFSRRLSTVDIKLSDVLHRLEVPKDNGSEFNACEMYKLSSLLRDLRRERREIKNNLLKVECLLSVVKHDSDISSIESQFAKIDNSGYKPRILKDLF